jgi:hypothetical protein
MGVTSAVSVTTFQEMPYATTRTGGRCWPWGKYATVPGAAGTMEWIMLATFRKEALGGETVKVAKPSPRVRAGLPTKGYTN